MSQKKENEERLWRGHAKSPECGGGNSLYSVIIVFEVCEEIL